MSEVAGLIERLRNYADDDHERLCKGREYSCTCGYDEKRDPLLADAADALASQAAEIERLREALKPFANYMDDGMDCNHIGEPLPDADGVGWVYLTQGDFRRARAALNGTTP